jgi:hypothetical protein
VILLKPQDIVVLLRLGLERGAPTLAALGAQLGISASEVHGAMNRAASAALLDLDRRRPRLAQLLEFLEHGIRYVFISRRGEITRGIPTAHSAPPLDTLLMQGPGPLARMFANRDGQGSGLNEEGGPSTYPSLQKMFAEPPLVWPHPEGEVRGESIEPLYPSAVDAARRDSRLYECLALVDALRVGRAREKKLAIDQLTKRLRAP